MEHKFYLSVRYNECDMYAHVNNAVYLSYLEHARVQMLKDIDFPLGKLTEAGYFLYIVKIVIEYKKPAQLDDSLEVITRFIKKNRTGGIFRQTIFRESALIADASVSWVCVDATGSVN